MYSRHFQGEECVVTPQLVLDQTRLLQNIDHTIQLAGTAERLWPHVKTHKCGQIIRILVEKGITRFKAATIAEAEMAARYGGTHVLLAYPLIGPNIDRFLNLTAAFPDVIFYALGDSITALEVLNQKASSKHLKINVLVDVDMGMGRTGVLLPLLSEFYKSLEPLQQLSVCGLHCYDGHRTEHDFLVRKKACDATFSEIKTIQASLKENGLHCDILIMGGTPSFPCYAQYHENELYLSPGTLFINDFGYSNKYPDLQFAPAAAVMTRVVSHPSAASFTLDLGYKGIAADPDGLRGYLEEIPHAHPLFQSEEHWVFTMDKGFEHERPNIGEILYIVPTHICPTTTLYPSIYVTDNQQLVGEWEVTARNRKLTY